jgi:hypothetical protein
VISFAKIPLDCTIRIYTVYGDLVKTYHHDSEDAEWGWDMLTESGQWVESGIYVYVLDSHWGSTEGETYISKFVIMR